MVRLKDINDAIAPTSNAISIPYGAIKSFVFIFVGLYLL